MDEIGAFEAKTKLGARPGLRQSLEMAAASVPPQGGAPVGPLGGPRGRSSRRGLTKAVGEFSSARHSATLWEVKLSSSDKAPLRDIVEDLVASNPTESSPWYGFKSEAAAREHLATRGGFSPGSLASVCDYARYPATSALNAVPDSGIDRDFLVFAGRRLRHAAPGAEYQEALTVLHGFALRMNPSCTVTVDAFAALIDDYNRRVDRLPDGGIRFDPDTRGDLLPSLPRGRECFASEDAQGEDHQGTIGDTGAGSAANRVAAQRPSESAVVTAVEAIDPSKVKDESSPFDNRTKREWRQAWEDFLGRSLPRDFFRQARVLCFPADEVEPEVSIYLRLGVSPDRIYAVEGSPKYRETFERNCRRLGLTPHFGRLEELLPTFTDPFSVVSLDFLGPYHPSYVSLASKIPCADRVATLVNIEAKREGKDIQGEVLKSLSQTREVLARIDFLANAPDPNLARHLMVTGQRLTDGPAPEFAEARETIADTIISSAVGFEYRALRGERGNRVAALLPLIYEFKRALKDPSPYPRSYRCLNALMEKLGDTFSGYAGLYKGLFRQVSTSDLRRATGFSGAELALAATWFAQILTDSLLPTHVERVRYWSESSRARSPFLSTFAVQEAPAVSSESRKAVNELLLRVGQLDLSLDGVADGQDYISRPYAALLCHGATGRPKTPGAELRKADYVAHAAKGVGTVGKMPVSALLEIAACQSRLPKGELWKIGTDRMTVGTPPKSSL